MLSIVHIIVFIIILFYRAALLCEYRIAGSGAHIVVPSRYAVKVFRLAGGYDPAGLAFFAIAVVYIGAGSVAVIVFFVDGVEGTVAVRTFVVRWE